jgi:putative addiction module component (TIGR02574 family)
MVRTTPDITAAALALPAPERLALATRLLDSLRAPDPDAESTWVAEAVRRIREVNDGHVRTMSTDSILTAVATPTRAGRRAPPAVSTQRQ